MFFNRVFGKCRIMKNTRAIFAATLIMAAFVSCAKAESKLSSGRWVLYSNKPGSSQLEGMVTGNGRHGMRVMGRPVNERITFHHEELFLRFWDREIEMVADIGHLLPEVRRLIDEGKDHTAWQMPRDEAVKQLTEKRQTYRKAVSPHPAFDLCIKHDLSGTAGGYRHQMDLETGESLVSWSDKKGRVEQRTFSSRTHNVNVVHFKGIDGRKLAASVFLEETPGRKGTLPVRKKYSMFGDVQLEELLTTNPTVYENGWMIYDADYALDPGGYQGVSRVSIKGGKMVSGANGIKIADADEILIVTRIVSQADGKISQVNEIKKELSTMPSDYLALFKPHAREHQEMFLRVTLDLGAWKKWKTVSSEKQLVMQKKTGVSPLFLEQRHAIGRYLLISSCGKYPPPLEGIWVSSWKPAWDGGFVLDANVNLQISAAGMGDLRECVMSWLSYIKSVLPGWRVNARNYFGSRGFLAVNYADPENGYLCNIAHHHGFMYWAAGAGWNLHPLYDYAVLSNDREFMKTEVLPLYLELADFYEDYMVLGEDGLYHIYPGVSPENYPLTGSNGSEKPTDKTNLIVLTKDCAHDIAVAREVFRILIELGEQFDLDAAKIGKWNNWKEKLVPYRINRNGALAEWIPERYKDQYNHRHTSHLLGIYPFGEFQRPTADPEVVRAARIALQKRVDYPSPLGHGMMYRALMSARMHEVDNVNDMVQRLAKVIHYFNNNLATSHGRSKRAFILDAAMSFPRLLMEMLVFSRPGYIDLMPAWPKQYPDGSLKGVLIRGGHKIDLAWKNGTLVSATLHAGRDDSGTIAYGGIEKPFDFKANKRYVFDNKLQVVEK